MSLFCQLQVKKLVVAEERPKLDLGSEKEKTILLESQIQFDWVERMKDNGLLFGM